MSGGREWGLVGAAAALTMFIVARMALKHRRAKGQLAQETTKRDSGAG